MATGTSGTFTIQTLRTAHTAANRHTSTTTRTHIRKRRHVASQLDNHTRPRTRLRRTALPPPNHRAKEGRETRNKNAHQTTNNIQSQRPTPSSRPRPTHRRRPTRSRIPHRHRKRQRTTTRLRNQRQRKTRPATTNRRRIPPHLRIIHHRPINRHPSAARQDVDAQASITTGTRRHKVQASTQHTEGIRPHLPYLRLPHRHATAIPTPTVMVSRPHRAHIQDAGRRHQAVARVQPLGHTPPM